MGTHFPATGYSPTTPGGVGPESLSVAVAVKNAINDPLLSLKSDANTQQQPNSSPLVSLSTHRLEPYLLMVFVFFRQRQQNSAQ